LIKRFIKKVKNDTLKGTLKYIILHASCKGGKCILKKANKETSMFELLETIAKTEKHRVRTHMSYGIQLEKIMLTDDGLQELGKVAYSLLKTYPHSILLNYLYTVSLAKSGEFEKAHEYISNTIIDASNINTSSFSPKRARIKDSRKKRTLIKLINIWRTIDLIAKQNMRWLSGDQNAKTQYKDLAFLSILEKENEDTFHPNLHFAFLEPILQGKNQELYLKKCEVILNNVNRLSLRVKAIKYMLRQGERRVASQKEAYALATASYYKIRDEIFERINVPKEEVEDPKSYINITSMVLDLTTVLNITDDTEMIKDILVDYALSPYGQSIVYQAAYTLLKLDPIQNLELSKEVLKHAERKPRFVAEMKAYMAWANLAQEYKLAYKMYSKKSNKIKAKRSTGEYTRILQRLARFKEAKKVNSLMHAKILTAPHIMNAYTSWNLLKRTNELAFLEETAKIYKSVPQPSNPKGVIFLTARNIEQLTKTPIMVLLELKRMGWAVIPLVNGLLPRETTGIEDIDCFIGSMTLDRDLNIQNKDHFEEIEPLNFDADKGMLKWRDIDLSHILWEDATIYRRVYEPDYSCPKMNDYLNNLVKWTYSSTYILHNAKRKLSKLNLRAGFMIALNTRLPDAMYRFYCEKYGSADDFFCLHAANGYQNYFANFSTNVSTKGVIRNMTKHPETRSASFPVPSEFEAYYNANEHHALEVLKRVEDITKMKRSTGGNTTLPDEANEVLEKVSNWKKNGGKVACAFGKVVFDSSVPYDGGPIHQNMKEWINHTIDIVKDSNTLLLIKPHPHEINHMIASFPNAYFADLLTTELNDNVIILGHKWFDLHMLKGIVDLGIIYNGTTAIELAILGIPTIVCSHFAPIDYPIGHCVPQNEEHYKDVILFKEKIEADKEVQKKAALWLDYMSGDSITLDYRYHSRQITNKVIYPPYWFEEDLEKYFKHGDPNVRLLAQKAIA